MGPELKTIGFDDLMGLCSSMNCHGNGVCLGRLKWRFVLELDGQVAFKAASSVSRNFLSILGINEENLEDLQQDYVDNDDST